MIVRLGLDSGWPRIGQAPVLLVKIRHDLQVVD
jgi:hypothetical protein